MKKYTIQQIVDMGKEYGLLLGGRGLSKYQMLVDFERRREEIKHQKALDDALTITVEAREIDDSKALPAAIQDTPDYDYSPDLDETCYSPDYQHNSAVVDDCDDYHVDSGEDPDDPRTWIYSFSSGSRSLALNYLEEIDKWQNELSGLTDNVDNTAYKEHIKYNIQTLKRSIRKAFDDHRYIIDAVEYKAFLKRKYGEIPGVTDSIPFPFTFKEKKQLREVIFHVQIFDTADTDFAGKCLDWKIKYYGSKYIQFSNDNGNRCLVYFPSQDVFKFSMRRSVSSAVSIIPSFALALSMSEKKCPKS